MVFHYLMLVPRGYSSPYFKGKEITTFLRSLNRYFKDYRINDNKEKKEHVIEYSSKCFKKDIKQLPEYKDSTSVTAQEKRRQGRSIKLICNLEYKTKERR